MSFGRGWRALGLAAVLALSCAQPSVVREGRTLSVEQAAEADLASARALLKQKQPAKAEQILLRFQTELAKSRRADEAQYLLAEAQLAQNQPERAAESFRRLVEVYPRSAWNAEAAIRAAELYAKLDRPDDGRLVLSRASADSADEATRARLYLLQARLARASGDWPDAVRALAYARRDEKDPARLDAIDREVAQLLEQKVREPELEALVPRLPRGPVYDRVNLELARRALERNDAARARAALDRLPRQLSPADEEERALLLARASDRGADAEATIGLVLPLSGPFAPIGESILRGVVLGSGIYDEPPSKLRLRVRDSGGDPDRAAVAARELASDGVAAILGPVRSGEVVAAAPIAEEAHVPLLSFARRKDVADLGEYVFRLGLTPEEQAEALARWCAEQRSCRRYAALYPEDEYGTSFKNSFWQAIEAHGGSMVAIEAYKPGSVDWQPEIKRLVGLADMTPAQRALVRERDKLRRRPVDNAARLASPEFARLPPYVDFDAVFIPDDAESVGLILPQLRFFDVRDVVFLGGSGWNDPALVKIAAREATRAVFTDEFFAGSARPAVVEFVRRYTAAHGAAPDAYAAEGFDAGALVRSALAQVEGASGEVLRDRLLGTRAFAGATGLDSFDGAGGAIKTLEFLTVRGNAITAIAEPPQAPAASP